MHLKAKLDLSQIKILSDKVKEVYLIDTSVILNYAKIDKYNREFNDKFKESGLYVLTCPVLREVDKREDNRRIQFDEFKEILRKLSSPKNKLSKGKKTGENYIIFLPFDLKKIQTQNELLSNLDETETDTQLLKLALELKDERIKCTIVSRDNLLKVLCDELNIKHIFTPRVIEKKDTTTGDKVLGIFSLEEKNQASQESHSQPKKSKKQSQKTDRTGRKMNKDRNTELIGAIHFNASRNKWELEFWGKHNFGYAIKENGEKKIKYLRSKKEAEDFAKNNNIRLK